MNSSFLIEAALGVDLVREGRRKRLIRKFLNLVFAFSVLVVMFIGIKVCLEDLDKPVYAEQTRFVTGYSDPSYFSFMMENDPQFRKEVEEADRIEAARFKL